MELTDWSIVYWIVHTIGKNFRMFCFHICQGQRSNVTVQQGSSFQQLGEMLCMYALYKNHILFIPRQVFIWPKPHPPTLSLAASSWWEVSSSSEMRRWFCVTSCVFSSRRCVKQWRREGCYKGRKQTVKRRPFFMSNALTVTGLVTLYIEKQIWLAIQCY